MKIVEIKQALIGHNIVLRVVTDKGIDGYSEIENTKEAYIGAVIPYFAGLVKGLDPTDVSYVMAAMKRAGAFKPWGAVVSAIEMACWDIAGKEAGVPVYKLLGGKVRNKVRVYNGSFKTEMYTEKMLDGNGHFLHPSPQAYKEVIVPAVKAVMEKCEDRP